MRFLHSADLHLDSPLRSQALKNAELAATLRAASRRALARIVDTAIAQDVDALLLAGDVFDSGQIDVASRAALAAELGRLGAAGIPTVMIRGNHDALLDMASYGPIGDSVVQLNRDTPTFRVGEASIHGLGFTTRHVAETMLPDYPVAEPGRINIGLMHTSLGGAEGHDPYAPCSEADLLGWGYDYWGLGHIHKRFERRSERSLAVMPGIPQGRSIRETGQGSATLIEIDGAGVRASEVPIALVRFEVQPLDLSGAQSQAAQIATMADAMRTAGAAGPVALRLRLRGAGSLPGTPDFARQLAEEAAAQTTGVFVEAVRFDRDRTAVAPGVLSDLAAMMAEDAASAGFRDEAGALIEEWRRALPREVADVLAPEGFDALVEEGIEMMLARLGAGGEAS
jgi:DNA repair protein SbcD/Mre11